MRIITLEQGSDSWHEWRDGKIVDGKLVGGGIGASEAPIIMGVSPYSHPQRLWEEKTGRRARQQGGFATDRGHLTEPVALAAYEAFTGKMMMKVCAEHDEYPFIRASYDGMSVAYDDAVEIKWVGEEGHRYAEAGMVPPWYAPQLAQQMFVAGLDRMDYWSFYVPVDGKIEDGQGRLLEVYLDPVLIESVLAEDLLFWSHVQSDVPMYTQKWGESARVWRSAKLLHGGIEQALDKAKADLVRHTPQQKKTVGEGVSVTRSWRMGDIDWAKLAEDLGISEEVQKKYRKDGSDVITVRRSAG